MIRCQIAAVRIGDGFTDRAQICQDKNSTGMLRICLPQELGMVWFQGQDQIKLLQQVTLHRCGSMRRKIHTTLRQHKLRALRGGLPCCGTRSGGSHRPFAGIRRPAR